jgi:hypothetical protein
MSENLFDDSDPDPDPDPLVLKPFGGLVQDERMTLSGVARIIIN